MVHEDTPDKFTVVDTIKTQQGARTMANDTSNHNVYTVTADMMPAPAPTTGKSAAAPGDRAQYVHAVDLQIVVHASHWRRLGARAQVRVLPRACLAHPEAEPRPPERVPVQMPPALRVPWSRRGRRSMKTPICVLAATG